MLAYQSGNMIARLAPIKEDGYEKKVGPGSYNPEKALPNVGTSVWGKSKDKRKLWFEGRIGDPNKVNPYGNEGFPDESGQVEDAST